VKTSSLSFFSTPAGLSGHRDIQAAPDTTCNRHDLCVLVAMTALSWVVALAIFAAWPLAGVMAWFVVRWWRKHDEQFGESGGG
jgi:hypothetical protein